MHNDTDYEEMLIEQRYTKKWSMIIRHGMNIRKDIQVPSPDGEEPRRHPLPGLGVPCDKDGWTPMELLYKELNDSFNYIRIFGLRAINHEFS